MKIAFTLLILLLSTFVHTLASEDTNTVEITVFENKLSGNWGGFRNDLAKNGIEIDLLYFAEPWYINNNSITDNFYFVDYFQLSLSLNMHDLLGLSGGKMHINYIGNNGGFPGAEAGVAQGISSIEADNAYKFLDFLYYQDFFDDKLCIQLGLIDLNAHFDVKNTAGVFINPSHGIGADFAQSGENGPSIFPNSSLGAVIRIQPLEDIYIQSGVFDGVAGDPNNPKGPQIILKNSDGLLVASTLYYLTGSTICEQMRPCLDINRARKLIDNYSKLGFGFWYYTDDYRKLTTGITNWGMYMMFEEDVYLERDDPHQGLSFKGRIGVADEYSNQFNYFIGAGLVYTGLIPGRNLDQCGFALATGHNSHNYRINRINNNEYSLPFETDIELTYKAFIIGGLSWQIDFQYVQQPSLIGFKQEMFFIGNRLELSF